MRRRALLVAGLVAAACAPLACRKKRRFARFPGAAPPGGPGVLFAYDLRPDRAPEPGDSREAMIGRTVEVLRRRVARLTDGGVVRPSESGPVEVFLPQGPAALYEAFRRIARVPGRFQILLVDNDSPYMKALVERARGLSFEGVIPAADAWSAPNAAGDREDILLRARDREALAAAVEKLTAAVPLPANRAILLEKENGVNPDGSPHTTWRTYYVETSGGIGNADIVDASPARSFDEWQVQVVLTAQGRKTFGEMTTQGVGRKIAIVFDGDVRSAPVVATPIPGGRLYITTGSNRSLDPALLKDEVEDLALVLNSGPLPAPTMLLVEEQAQRIPEPTPR
jgi:preprotein translocase subunit SecD